MTRLEREELEDTIKAIEMDIQFHVTNVESNKLAAYKDKLFNATNKLSIADVEELQDRFNAIDETDSRWFEKRRIGEPTLRELVEFFA